MKVYYYCSLAFNIDVYLVYVYLTLTLECIYVCYVIGALQMSYNE